MKANVKNSLVHRLVSLYTVSMIWSNYYIVCTHYMAGSIPLKTIRDAASNQGGFISTIVLHKSANLATIPFFYMNIILNGAQ